MRARQIKSIVSLTLTLGVIGLLQAAPASAASPVKISAVYFQVLGAPSPPTNYYLNKEYVVIRNSGSSAVTVTGWTVRDLARLCCPSHVYKFGTYRLGAGQLVRIHTGKGTNTATDRYW